MAKVLVTGATGKQGGAVARALASNGHAVRALTRNPASPAATGLAATGAEVVAGSFADAASLRRAMDGVDAVFAMGTFFERGPDGEVAEGLALVDAAREARVGHVVYTSVASADRKTGIPHFDSKAKVEAALIASGRPYTILAPVYFMENLWFPQSVGGLRAGTHAVPLPPGRKLQQVAVADIGRFAVVAIERKLVGQRIELAGDDLDGVAAAKALSERLGREIRFQELPLAAIQAMSEDLYLMYKFFADVGYAVDIAALRRTYPEVGWHTFSAWLADQDLAPLR